MGCYSSQPKLIEKKTYFHFNQSQIVDKANNYQNYKTPVKLDFTLEGCQINHKYQIEVIMNDNNETFYTENALIKQNVVTFNTCYICDYFFERQQYLNIQLLKNNQTDGINKVTLGTIVGSPNCTYKISIGSKGENIIINAQSLKDTDSFIDFDFIVKNNNIDFSDINNKISYKIYNQGRILYQSESISSFGKFDPIRIPMAILEPEFTIYFLNSRQKTLTFKNETINTFIQPNQKILFYLGLNVNNNTIGIYNNSKIYREYSFIDYLKNGVTIKLTLGIDFTSSNLPPLDPKSLHYLGGGMNDYECAIRACGSVVAYYDYNQLFPVYGFGAQIIGENKPNMCFNINFKKNPEIYTIDNVIKEYHKCFKNIMLAGPTEFCPLIKKVNETIKKENNPLKYHILMILTDGIIVDQQQTIDALVQGSFLPLSVIIIGIGNNHFQEMIQLDGDEIPLIDSRGVKRMRDLVQFVPFNKYKNDPNELVAQVLEEIPRQIMEYFTMNNIYPHNLAISQFNKFNFNNDNNNDNNNSYISKIAKSCDNKSFLENNINLNFINNNSLRTSTNNYHTYLDDEKLSRGTGTTSIYY